MTGARVRGNPDLRAEYLVRLRLHFGTRLRKARERQCLTQATVAQAVGIHQGVYGRMEGGKMLPSLSTLHELCRVLSVRPDDLLLSAQMAEARPKKALQVLVGSMEDTPQLRRFLRSVARLTPRQLEVITRTVGSFTQPSLA